ncbi:hypothetical protein [Geminocystis herdmanii]|nr:hypothetical protein [Geminocystis herdmanii]
MDEFRELIRHIQQLTFFLGSLGFYPNFWKSLLDKKAVELVFSITIH